MINSKAQAAESKLVSMTGFARASGSANGLEWIWEVRSVNGKGLDLRLRLPPGFEGLEAPVRNIAQAHARRGNLQATLSVTTRNVEMLPRVNHAFLEELVRLSKDVRARHGGGTVEVEQLFNVRGVLESAEDQPDEAALKARDDVVLASFEVAMRGLAASRAAEGQKLSAVLGSQLERIRQLAEAARDCPARNIDLQKRRLADAVARLTDASSSFDPQRLHQEAVLLFTKADVQEELDRLSAHIASAEGLLASGDAIGRKLDFLMQEFNREANTLCSKSPDPALTGIGLDLKTVIDQMREQVQNIE